MFKAINGGQLPQSQTRYSAGYDVYSNSDIVIRGGETKIIPLGIVLDTQQVAPFFETDNEFDEFHKKHYIGIYLRSGLGKKGLILPNGVGVVDMDYKDEIGMIIHNPLTDSAGYENKDFEIKKGDRVGQLILHRHYGFDILGSNFRKDIDRVGGFGSSGK